MSPRDNNGASAAASGGSIYYNRYGSLPRTASVSGGGNASFPSIEVDLRTGLILVNPSATVVAKPPPNMAVRAFRWANNGFHDYNNNGRSWVPAAILATLLIGVVLLLRFLTGDDPIIDLLGSGTENDGILPEMLRGAFRAAVTGGAHPPGDESLDEGSDR